MLGWSQRGLAGHVSYAEGMVRMWARGAHPVPADIARWLEVRARHAERCPAPVRTRDGDPSDRAAVARALREAVEHKREGADDA